MSELSINISKLSEGTHQYAFEVAAASLDLDARFTKGVSVAVVLDKVGHQMHLKAHLRATGTFACDRCLDDFQMEIAADYQIVCSTEDRPVAGTSDAEIQYVGPDATLLDLGEDVRQFLILAVPQKLLCKEDCQGLCTVCGGNKNKTKCSCAEKDTDPRWEGLRKVSFN